ncbi:MAG: hypothetical protein GY922_10890 [Proteobacteria bacterium]|nr:hypothetical protein [Pseudomonadota bacterium]
MIGKGTNCRSGTAGSIVDHVLTGADNETIEVMHGDPDLILDLDEIALQDGHKFGVKQFIISPAVDLSDDEWDRAIEMHKDEFGWGSRDHCVVRHGKVRANGSDPKHVHILVAMSDDRGRQLHIPHEFRRNEKLQRKLEVEFGHELVKGRHNLSVMNALKKEGNQKVLAAMEEDDMHRGRPAMARFSSKMHARAKRHGVSLGHIAEDCINSAKNIQGVGEAMARAELNYGVTIRRGDRRDVLLMEKNGEVIANVNKMFKNFWKTEKLIKSLEDGRKNLKNKEISNAGNDQERTESPQSKSYQDGSAGGRRSRQSDARTESQHYREPGWNLAGAARSTEFGPGRDLAGAADGAGIGGAFDSGRKNGSGFKGPGQQNNGSDEASNRGNSKATGSSRGALKPTGISRLKLNTSVGMGFRKHAAKLPSRSALLNVGDYPFTSFTGGSEFPDLADPLYAEKVLQNWSRSYRAGQSSGL